MSQTRPWFHGGGLHWAWSSLRGNVVSSKSMKIAIVGPGAMGCLFAALLREAGHEVWLLDKSVERASKIAGSGVLIEGIGGTRKLNVESTGNARDIGGAELIFIWVKAYDTEAAVKSALPLLTERSDVVSLQNGLENLETIARYVDPERVIAGVTSHGATVLAVGSVRHTGKGDTLIGRIGKQADRGLHRAVRVLSEAGIEVKVSRDIQGAIWSKLIISSAINPLTAITRMKNGQLLESPETRRLLDLVAAESEKIAIGTGISLAYPDMKSQVRAVCLATASNRSSMLQDILRGRRTEIDAINGALAAKARALDMEAPLNEMLACLVKTLEKGAGLGA